MIEKKVMCCNKIWKVPSSNPTGHLAKLTDPTWLQGSQWPLGQKLKSQWLTLCDKPCHLENGPKLAMGQPNSS